MNAKISIPVFFFGAPLILLSCFIFLANLISNSPASPIPNSLTDKRVLSAQTGAAPVFLPLPFGKFLTTDARSTIIRNYLRKYSSPLESFSQDIVETSDKYSLDYRLLVAIAQQESNLCKKIPELSYNCWGFGIYGDKITRFENYPQALEIVARALKINYVDRGLVTPEEIMAKYTPPSLEKGGPWARGVSQFMFDLE